MKCDQFLAQNNEEFLTMGGFKTGIGFLVSRVPLIMEMIKKELDKQLSCDLGKNVHTFHPMTHRCTKKDISNNTTPPSLYLLTSPYGRDQSALLESGTLLRPFS